MTLQGVAIAKAFLAAKLQSAIIFFAVNFLTNARVKIQHYGTNVTARYLTRVLDITRAGFTMVDSTGKEY